MGRGLGWVTHRGPCPPQILWDSGIPGLRVLTGPQSTASRSRCLRLSQGQTVDDIPKEVLIDCAHLVKANSIQGNADSREVAGSCLWRVFLVHTGAWFLAQTCLRFLLRCALLRLRVLGEADVACSCWGCPLDFQKEEFSVSQIPVSCLRVAVRAKEASQSLLCHHLGAPFCSSRSPGRVGSPSGVR